MSIQHNDSLSLDWLMPIFEEYMDSLSEQWQDYRDGAVSAICVDMARDYHQLSGAMIVANLPLFADLTSRLSLLTLHVIDCCSRDKENVCTGTECDVDSLINLAYNSHKLLWMELSKYAYSGSYHQQLLINSSEDIAQLLPENEFTTNQTKVADLVKASVINETLSQFIELPKLEQGIIPLDSKQKQSIKASWQSHQQQLISDNSNDSPSVAQLYKLTQLLWHSCEVQLLQRLWYLTTLWLRCLANNSIPKPAQYKRVFTRLNKVLEVTLVDSFFGGRLTEENFDQDDIIYESLIAELYIQINLLAHIDEETKSVIQQLQIEKPQKVQFFTNILQQLEQVLFQLQEPEQVIQSLADIKQRLDRRGWAIYVTYLELIIEDLRRIIESDNEEDSAQIQWQIERQLQELYGAVFAMKQSIGGDDNQSENIEEPLDQAQLLRQVRISIETIKNQFKQYSNSHDVTQIPTTEFLNDVNDKLLEMKLSEAIEVVDAFALLFDRFRDNQLSRVSWKVMGATVDSIAEFEFFFDHLAQHVLDNNRLEQTLQRIEQTNALIDAFLQEDPLFVETEEEKDDSVMRYGDGGEIEPVVDTVSSSDDALAEAFSGDDQHKTIVLDAVSDGTAVDDVMTEGITIDETLEFDIGDIGTIELNDDSESYLQNNQHNEAQKEESFTLDFAGFDDFVEGEAFVADNVSSTHVDSAHADTGDTTTDGEAIDLSEFDGFDIDLFDDNEKQEEQQEGQNVAINLAVGEDIDFANEGEFVIDDDLADDIAESSSPVIEDELSVSLDTVDLDINDGDVMIGDITDNDQLPVEAFEDIEALEDGLVAEIPLEEEPVEDNAIAVDDAVNEENEVLAEATGADDVEMTESVDNEVDASEVETSPALEEARQSLADDDFSMDEDIREIFIEEAGEVLEAMDEQLPAWQDDPSDLEQLKEIRRGFHTLKGSGRMVGANNVGEMSWAVENMLNRVLDNTINVNDELVTFIADTKEKIPTLVADFANEQSPSIDPAITVLRANNLLAGRDINEGLPASITDSLAGVLSDSSTEAVLQAQTNVAEHDDSVATGDTDAMVSDESGEAKQEQSSEGFRVGDLTLPMVLQPFWNEAQNLPSDTSDMDEDIKEIFIEEADEVLETIVPEFVKWSADTGDSETLTEIRRGFHTLKGSGRMVGANTSAELAWSVENMLNRVLDHTVGVDAGMLALVNDVLRVYPELVATFEQSTNDYPEVVSLWVACAHAYSKNLGDQFDYRALSAGFLADDADMVTASPVTDDSAKAISEAEQNMLGSIREVNEKLVDGVGSTHKDLSKDEREFIDIFVDEAEGLLATIDDFVKENQDKTEIVVNDKVVRAFHTLRGASGSDALQDISDVSGTIEANLVHLQHNESLMNEQHLQAIAQSSALIAERLTDYQAEKSGQQATSVGSHTDVEDIHSLLVEGQEATADVESNLAVRSLIVDIDDLLESEWELEYKLQEDEEQVLSYAQRIGEQIATLQARTLGSSSFQSLLVPLGNVYQAIISKPELATDEDILLALISAHEQLTNLFDSLAGNMSLQVDQHIVDKLNEIVANVAGDVDELVDGVVDEQSELVSATDVQHEDTNEEVSEEVSAPVDASVEEVEDEPLLITEFETIETDAELLAIFLEEAQELESDITRSFSAWRSQPTDLDALKELQRHLHTIKGGARMAGISSIGDLTHEMETIYEKFVNQSMTPSEPWLNVMQTAQDTLSMQIEHVGQHHSSFFTPELIEQLLEFATLDELPADARLVLPVLQTEATEEVVEPTIEAPVEEAEEEFDEIESNFNNLVLKSWNSTLPDKDILEVFLEEADELIESTAQHLQGFISNTGNLSNLQALQRELHTIKGGARMVGTNSIADLSHEMETIYEGLGGRQLPATKKVTELLVACHDWLSGSIQLLKNMVNPPMPTALIKALQDFHRQPDELVDIPIISLQEYQDAIATYESYKLTLKGNHDTSEMPAMVGNFGDFKETADVSSEVIRVSSTLMEQMINLSGESAINRARVDMGISSLSNSIEEMGTTVQRLADQLRRMDIELEAQILAQIDDETLLEKEDFDPLEMDQYSSLNQLSKSLSESASDLLDIKSTLLDKTRDSENLLLQLSRTQTELQDSLMSSRMVPFSRLIPRLQRIVRQTANEVNKNVELKVINADDEMDRSILERITSPLEHMLRNAVDHGIELPDERVQLGKNRTGRVTLSVSREGSELVIELSDDGHGINVESVRKKAISQGLIDPNDTSLTDADVMQYIFNAGLSTTKKVTQISGRGVGMDVVRSEIRQLGGTVSVESKQGKGSRFIMRVPLTVAVSDALIVRAADRRYAIPLVQIERVEQVSPDDLFTYYQSDSHTFNIFGADYRLRYLNEILTGSTVNDLAIAGNSTLPVIIIKNQTGQNLALQVDEIVGSRQEVVVKPLGKQLSHVSGVSAATIMGDGSVMLILDLIALIRNAPIRKITKLDTQQTADVRKKVLVIDDSVTVRKVTSRFLEREGFDTHVAKDGVDALRILQEFTPDIMLLDIEMPRMDGFEVATQVRHNERLKETPIIMITSRTGDKHRERAMEVGVNDYLGKPFQENVLLERISSLLGLNLVIHDDK